MYNYYDELLDQILCENFIIKKAFSILGNMSRTNQFKNIFPKSGEPDFGGPAWNDQGTSGRSTRGH